MLKRDRGRGRDRSRRVVVIGLGRFGTSAARTLTDLGYEVTAIDRQERPVAEASSYVTLAVQGDGTDEELLRSVNVDESEYGIVAQGETLEASVLSALLLKKMGVPFVVAKATNDLHRQVLERIGVDRVVLPERVAGAQMAHTLPFRRNITEYFSLTETTGVAKLQAPTQFVGSSLADIHRAANPKEETDRQLSVLAILRRNRRLIAAPQFGEIVEDGDELIVTGSDEAIAAFNLADPRD